MVIWGDGRISSCEMLPSFGNIKDKKIRKVHNYKEVLQKNQYYIITCAVPPSKVSISPSVVSLIASYVNIEYTTPTLKPSFLSSLFSPYAPRIEIFSLLSLNVMI